ncbi:ECF transporter S component [Clostridium tunisiense]|uniref:ECF transporter S component n=1 Tax=Clostridium tunisiense TaxID=219748 RepID=UPI0002ECFB2B|nr:ECF transporter S component [Clostridium tunisiense]
MQSNVSTTRSAKLSTKQLAIVGMLSAISMILGMTPLGFIQLPFMSATIMHIPVIIGAVLEGPVVGALVGLIFGIFSMIRAFSNPTLTAFLFMNPIIAILPRILIGIGSYYIYKLVKIKAANIRIGIASIMGSFINTIGVLGISYLLYGNKLAEVMGISKTAVGITFLTTAGTNGVAEAAISALITIPVVGALRKILK